jgi:hypothetical protein
MFKYCSHILQASMMRRIMKTAFLLLGWRHPTSIYEFFVFRCSFIFHTKTGTVFFPTMTWWCSPSKIRKHHWTWSLQLRNCIQRRHIKCLGWRCWWCVDAPKGIAPEVLRTKHGETKW